MEFLKNLFFESPVKLGIFSFLLFAIVLFARQRMQSPAWRGRILPLTLFLILSLFVVQAWVVTERERILDRLDKFVGAIEMPNRTILASLIASGYDAEGLDKNGFLDALDNWLKRIDVYDSFYRRRDVDIHGDLANMTLGAGATVIRNGGTGESHWGVWEFDWVKENGEWRIRAIRIEMIDGMPVDRMRPLLP